MPGVLEQSIDSALSGSGSYSATFLSAPQSGNILFSAFAESFDTADPSAIVIPPGWTEAFRQTSFEITIIVAYKVSDGTETTAITWDATALSTATRTSMVWIGEYSGLTGAAPHATPTSRAGNGGIYDNVTAVTVPSQSYTAKCMVLAFSVTADANSWGATRSWTDGLVSFHTHFAGSGGLNYASVETVESGSISPTFSHDGTADRMAAGMLLWELAATGPSVDDINTDEIVLDGQQNATFTTTGFGGEITTVRLKSGLNTLLCTGVTSVSGAGTFDIPDISALSADTPGCPFTTASHNIVVEVTNE